VGVKKFYKIMNNEKEVEIVWKTFKKYFWILIFGKLLFYGLMNSSQTVEEAYVFSFLQLPFILGMVILIGRTAYLLTEKRVYWLCGILGFIWVGFFGVLGGYYLLSRLKSKAMRERFSHKSWAWFYLIIVLLLCWFCIVSLIYVISQVQANALQ
jgi:hypothetical protein